jgi:alanyl-tRNA synthetase
MCSKVELIDKVWLSYNHRMDSQLLYQQDPAILEFEAQVVESIILPDGRTGVVLDRTYFYPTGGGQEHDTGALGGARVVDVFKDEDHSRLIHVVEGEVGWGAVKACIDAERRLRHMQHHTGQHLLTQCILRQTGYETVSANINGYSPSTLDIVATQINKSDLDQAELMANQIIYQDRPVKTYFVSPEELKSIPLRRPPRVTENIRIVEIDSYDYSPCGGTHVLHTGSIGLVKVLRAERQNDKLRVYFIAGLQAMQVFHQMYDSFAGLANKMSISWQDLPEVVSKQSEQLGELHKELQSLRQAGVRYEARDLAAAAEESGGIKLVRVCFDARPMAELRLLGEEFKRMADVVAYLASYDGQKVSLIVICGEGTGQDARQLLTTQLAQIGGRGGGDAKLAQGGGVAREDQLRTFLQQVGLR